MGLYSNRTLSHNSLKKLLMEYPIFEIDMYDSNSHIGDTCIYFIDRAISNNPVNISIKGNEVVITGSRNDRFLMLLSMDKKKGSFKVGNNNIVISDHYGGLLLDNGIKLVDNIIMDDGNTVPLYDQVAMKRRSIIKNIINE